MTQKYARVDGDGFAVAFYSDDIHTDIPADAFPIDEDMWKDWCARQFSVRWNGSGLEDRPPAPPRRIRVIRAMAFRERVSEARRSELNVAAMQAAAQGDGQMLTFILDQAASTTTNLDSPRVQAGVAQWLAQGVISQAEADAFLADGTPEEAA